MRDLVFESRLFTRERGLELFSQDDRIELRDNEFGNFNFKLLGSDLLSTRIFSKISRKREIYNSTTTS